jgi:hypothetical protein
MNIKKIIREEMDGWDWARDTKSPVYKGMLFYYYEEGPEDLYKVMELTDEYDAIIGRPYDTDIEGHHSRYPINKVVEYIESGVWIEYTPQD